MLKRSNEPPPIGPGKPGPIKRAKLESSPSPDLSADEEKTDTRETFPATAAPAAPAAPAAKKQSDVVRTNDPVRLHVRETLEKRAVYEHGALQLDPAVAKLVPRAKPDVVLPPRAEHNARTLLPEYVRPMVELLPVTQTWMDMSPMDAMRALYSPNLYGLAARMRVGGQHFVAPQEVIDAVETFTNTSGASNGPSSGDPLQLQEGNAAAAEVARPDLFPSSGVVDAPVLLKKPVDARAGGSRPVHLLDVNVGALGAPQRLVQQQTPGAPRGDPKRAYHEALASYRLKYYDVDPIPDPEIPFGRAPRAYPMFKDLFEDSAAQWLGNNDLTNQSAEGMPRTNIELCSRAYLQDALLPPDPAFGERGCCADSACRGAQLAIEEDRKGLKYVVKEFQTPSQQDAWRKRRLAGVPLSEEPPPGLCLVCTSWHVTNQVMNGLQHKQQPLQPINTFRVFVGKGGYSAESLLPEVLDGVKTCISGHVPYFDKMHYQFEQLKDGRTVLCEVNTDFHDSLSQSNTCLGVRKTRALAGSALSGFLPLTPERAASHMRFWNAVHLPIKWVRYLCTAPKPVLADRALVDAAASYKANGAREPTRVPVLWLRQAYGLDSRDTIPDPIATAIRERMAPTTGWQLMQHYGCETPTELARQLVCDLRGALVPFEDAVDYVAQHPVEVDRVLAFLYDPGAAMNYTWVRDAILTEFAGLPNTRPPSETNKGLVWRTVVYRIIVALLAQRVLRPWPVTATGELYARNTRYFIHTHLSYLVEQHGALSRPGEASCILDDDYWLELVPGQEEPRLTRAYPQSTNVCCFEELADLSASLFAVNDTYDMSGKKSPPSLLNALLHPEQKSFHGTCQRRGFDGILCNSMQNYPSVGALFMLIMRVVLLGNLPNASVPVTLAAAIRITATFSEDLTQERMSAWIRAHPLISMALLREHRFALGEANGVVDERRSLYCGWQRFKALARQCGAQIRRFISYETAAHGIRAPFDWSVLEQRVGNTSVGEVLHWHEKQKEHNIKLRKDSDVGLLLKKMRPEEKRLTPEALEDAYEWMRSDDRLEATHICAFRAARQRQTPLDGTGDVMRSALPTGYLKLLGLSEPSFTALRNWMHLSIEFSSPDNPIKKTFAHMVDTCPRDVVLLKTYLRLVEYYSNSLPFFLPADQFRATIRAARTDLGMPDFVASSPRLGFAYYCRGCLTWATPVVEPSSELLGLSTMPNASKKRRRRGNVNANAAAPAPAAAPVNLNKKKIPPRPWPARPCLTAEGRASCMKKVVFHPLEAQLYCHRYRPIATQGDGVDEKDANDTVPWVQDDDREDAPLDSQPTTEKTEKKKKKKKHKKNIATRGDDGDDDDDDDENDSDEDSDSDKENDDAHDVSRPLFADMNCSKPLIAMDMLGVWRWARGKPYGLCVYCARLCEVHSVNMTNLGLSCGEHAITSEYPRYHRIWKHIQRPSTASAEVRKLVSDRCCFPDCDTLQRSMIEVDVYDSLYRRSKVHLCDWHHHCVRALLPRTKDTVVPPVPLKTLFAVATRNGKISVHM